MMGIILSVAGAGNIVGIVSRMRWAFSMPLRRAGTVPNAGVRYGPGSAAHRHSASKTRVNALLAKSYALRCVRGTRAVRYPLFFARIRSAKRLNR